MTNFLKATAIKSEQGLTLGTLYRIVGMDFETEKTFFYVVTSDSPLDIQRLDETFFAEQDFAVPAGWSFKVNPHNSTQREIILTELVLFDNWYDLYQKSDPQVMEILAKPV